MNKLNEKEYYIIFKDRPNFNNKHFKVLMNVCDGNFIISDYFGVNNKITPQIFFIELDFMLEIQEILNNKNLSLLNIHNSIEFIRELCQEVLKGNKITIVETKNYYWNNI
jgi:hypothetical protein